MSAPTSTRSTPAVVPAFNPQQIQQKQTQQHQRLEEEEQNQQVAIPLAEEHTAHVHLPRVTIKYCTQCKWLLRAAYVCSYNPRFSFSFLNPSNNNSISHPPLSLPVVIEIVQYVSNLHLVRPRTALYLLHVAGRSISRPRHRWRLHGIHPA